MDGRSPQEEEYSLNNNRNNRRRGRSNRNQGGSGNSANRIDSRARGNAPQLLDKYKKLAQDAQHHGDRVQAEYYLQFADHYFRVIADNKARQDEAKAKRSDDRRDNDGDDGEDGDTNRRPRNESRGDNRNDGRNDNRRGRSRRDNDDQKQGREGEPYDADEQVQDGPDEEKPVRKRSPRKPRSNGAAGSADKGEIDAAALPPSIMTDEDTPTPRKRAIRRRKDPAADSDGDTELSVAG